MVAELGVMVAGLCRAHASAVRKVDGARAGVSVQLLRSYARAMIAELGVMVAVCWPGLSLPAMDEIILS